VWNRKAEKKKWQKRLTESSEFLVQFAKESSFFGASYSHKRCVQYHNMGDDFKGLNLVDEAYETKMVAFESDCNDGNGEASACHHVGEFLSIVKDKHKNAAVVYEGNCKKGYGPSCFNLGKLFLAGKGVRQDDNEAETLFTKACGTGHVAGCYHQALLMYLQSTPSESNVSANLKKQKEAIQLFEKNCKNGDSDSCYFAGSAYIKPSDSNTSIARNPLKAVDYFKASCASNHGPSCYNLAVLYKKGDVGIPADEKLFEEYKVKTNTLVTQYGGLGGQKTA